MKDWALILGASSGFGAATAKKLAAEGINIFGVHLDRRSAHNEIQNLINELKKNNVNVVFQNMNDKHLSNCKICKSTQIERLVSAGSGLIFKGSGFYLTDYNIDKKNKGQTESGIKNKSNKEK